MASTLEDLIWAVRQHLYTGRREARNRLSGSHDASTTTFTFAFDLNNLRAGSKVSVGLEDCHVWASADASKTATVERGEFGSTAASHADGTIATINARFSDFEVLRAINDELAGLSAGRTGLFQMKAVDVTYNPAIQGYDLDGVESDFLDVYDVAAKQQGPEKDWPLITSFRVARNMATTEFATGNALIVYQGGFPGLPMRVRYKAAFDPLAALTDNVVSVSGAPSTLHDVVAAGAAIRLVSGREVARNFDETQGDTRRAEEVPPGANVNALRGLVRLYERRVDEEASRLAVQFPTMNRRA